MLIPCVVSLCPNLCTAQCVYISGFASVDVFINAGRSAEVKQLVETELGYWEWQLIPSTADKMSLLVGLQHLPWVCAYVCVFVRVCVWVHAYVCQMPLVFNMLILNSLFLGCPLYLQCFPFTLYDTLWGGTQLWISFMSALAYSVRESSIINGVQSGLLINEPH